MPNPQTSPSHDCGTAAQLPGAWSSTDPWQVLVLGLKAPGKQSHIYRVAFVQLQPASTLATPEHEPLGGEAAMGASWRHSPALGDLR